MSNMLETMIMEQDISELRELLERHIHPNQASNLTDELLKDIVSVSKQDVFDSSEYISTLVSYTNILQSGKYKLQDYFKAVQFCSYKLGGMGNREAYEKTFPDRYIQRVKSGAAPKTFDTAATIYARGELVHKIMSQAMIPLRLIHDHKKHLAIDVLFAEMTTAKSEKNRIDAADKLLHHLKDPDEHKIELDVTSSATDAIADLKKATRELALEQRRQLEAGLYTAKEIAESKVIDAEVVENDI